jgi:hypothetical protein
MNSIIKDFLLVDFPSFKEFSKVITEVGNNVLLPTFVVALIIEFFGRLEFLQTLRRLAMALLLLSSFSYFHTSVTDYGFKVSTDIINSAKGKSNFIELWKKAQKELKKKKVDKKSGSIVGYLKNVHAFVWKDNLGLVAQIINTFIAISLILNMCIYSLVFHFNIALVGLVAVLSIIGFNKDLVFTPIKTSIWCAFVPVVISGIIVTIGSVLSNDNQTIYSLIQAFVLSILMLFSLPLSAYILKGDIVQWASKMGMISGAGVAIYGAKAAFSLAKKPAMAIGAPSLGKMSNFAKKFSGSTWEGLSNRMTGRIPSQRLNANNLDNETSYTDYSSNRIKSGIENGSFKPSALLESGKQVGSDLATIGANKIKKSQYGKLRSQGHGKLKSGFLSTGNKLFRYDPDANRSTVDSYGAPINGGASKEKMKKRLVPSEKPLIKPDPHGVKPSGSKEVMAKRFVPSQKPVSKPDPYGVKPSGSKEVMAKRFVPSQKPVSKPDPYGVKPSGSKEVMKNRRL